MVAGDSSESHALTRTPHVEGSLLSIVIVSFNTRELLYQCLNSLRIHCPDAEIVVVDNNSRDGSPEMVQSRFPNVSLVCLSENSGFAAANNVGIRRAHGDAVVLLNSDTIVEDDSLLRCHNWLQTQARVGALSPRLIGRDGQPQRCRHRYPKLTDLVREAIRRPRRSHERTPNSSFWLAGTCLMIRRQALLSLDELLDENYFMYWEDADICRRLQAAGWGLAVCDDAFVRHYGGASGGGTDEARRPDLHAWYQYGRHRWFSKHRPRWHGVCLWSLELADIPRTLIRGALRPEKRVKWAHARSMASVLVRRLFRKKPARLPS